MRMFQNENGNQKYNFNYFKIKDKSDFISFVVKVKQIFKIEKYHEQKSKNYQQNIKENSSNQNITKKQN